MIKTHIEPSQFKGIDKLPMVKEVWEKLVLWHKDTHMGLSAFYTKVGILEKKYTDGEDMHTHLDFLTMENRKLDKKAFNDGSSLKSCSCHFPETPPGRPLLLSSSNLLPTPHHSP